MPKNKPNKEKCIDLIVEELDKGITYTNCLNLFKRKWTFSESTFKRYWKEAKQKHTERRKAIEKKKQAQTTKNELQRHKRQILTREEALENLTKLAKGEAWKVSSEITIPSAGDRINAIKTINQMQGYNSPEERNINLSNTDPVEINFTDTDEKE